MILCKKLTMTQQEEKSKAINELSVKMLEQCLIFAKISIKPRSKYKITNDRRLRKLLGITSIIFVLKNQIKIIRGTPIFPSGGVGSVCEHGEEIFIKR